MHAFRPRRRSADQQALVRKYYQGYIPQMTVLDRQGNPVYDRAGEIKTQSLEEILDKALE